ncbi:MAG: winged helix-turn-helix domain-containing protein [Pseudomonadota bacterium]
MAPVPGDSCIRFGRFTVEPEARILLIDDAPASLGNRAFDLLLALVSHPGEVLEKRYLINTVWRGVVVEQNNLEVQICALRKLLGTRAIRTVPGRGYSFTPTLMGDVGAAGEPTQVCADADAQLTPLRGRETELRVLHELLGHQRLTTIVGPGGVGKTRLARTAVTAHHRQFPAGICRVDLAAVPAGSPIAAAVARALKLPRRVAASPATQLGNLSPNRPLLLVLENCEHVMQEVVSLANEVIQHQPLVQLLLTSQVPARVKGEHVLRLEPLEVPASPDAADALGKPAVALFFDNLEVAMHPPREPNPVDVEDAAAICMHLDGIPLAIELAAARVAVLGVHGVRRRLADRFQMLASTRAGGSAREQSLQGSLLWSWSLLSPQEQAVLTAVASFKGPFTIPMATRALAPLALNEWAAMDMLQMLRDKSMVCAASASPGRRAAFRLLESTRLFVQAMPGSTHHTRPPTATAPLN